MALTLTVLTTLALLFGTVWACAVFTNAIEWLGHRFKLSEGAVGSVLAAVGTALPETLVPIVAIAGSYFATTLHPEDAAHFAEQAHEIGIGAILGAPFLLSTLAMFLMAVSVFYFAHKKKRGRVMHLDLHLFKRDLSYFFPAYGTVLAVALIPWIHPFKPVFAGLMVVLYGIYVYRTLKIEHIPDDEFHLDPLTLAPKNREPATSLILMQTLLGLTGILAMAHLFVMQIHDLSNLLGIPSLVLSLIIAPIATELPEKFNSVVWIGKKKDNLAMGNVTGAMVFQSCIPPAVGMCFTPWLLDEQGLLSVLLCFSSAGILYASVLYRRILDPRVLLLGGVFYLVFLLYSVFKIVHV